MLKIASLERDAELLLRAKAIAEKLLQEHPKAVEAHLKRWLGQGEELVKV